MPNYQKVHYQIVTTRDIITGTHGQETITPAGSLGYYYGKPTDLTTDDPRTIMIPAPTGDGARLRIVNVSVDRAAFRTY